MESLSKDAVFIHPYRLKVDSPYSRLKRIVQRMTHLAVFDLFMGPKSSLYALLSAAEIPPEVLGLLIEWQISSFNEVLTKPELRLIVKHLIDDALAVYEPSNFPLRRTRYVISGLYTFYTHDFSVLLQQLLFNYRADTLYFNPHLVVEEVLLLARSEKQGEDNKLLQFQRQYEAAARILLVFHLHNRDGDTEATVSQAVAATKTLVDLFPMQVVPSPARQSSKHSPPIARCRAKRTSPRKKPVSAKTLPTTPKPQRSEYFSLHIHQALTF